MSHDSTHSDEPLNWGAAFFGWIVPGLGQVSIGHARRGILAGVGILGLFLGGLLIGGVDCVDRHENPLWFYAQAGSGPIALAADWANSALLKTGKVGELVETPSSMPRAAPMLVSSFKTVTPANEIGTLYCALAGLMNLVVIFDALKRRPLERDDSTKGHAR